MREALFSLIAAVGWFQKLVEGWHIGAGLAIDNLGIAKTTGPSCSRIFDALRRLTTGCPGG
jgi:hypothetical protein